MFAVGSWPLAGFRPLAFDPDLWPTPNLWQCLYSFLCLVNCSLVRFVAIQPLSNELLALLQSDRTWMNCLFLVARLIDNSRLSIHLAFGRSIVLGLSFGLLLNRLFATLFVHNFGSLRNHSQLSLALPSNCSSSLTSNCARFCLTVLNCSQLCRAVICQFCQAIVCNFSWSVDRSVPQPGVCKLFLTIGSSNCKQFKTKSIFK